ncbi:hypothetical protein TWF102_010983 [Orbilia oligospora]|nr:hypothetical protein TWF102_010983 [Orbilia oligospora]KAF3103891.1 hypothetical protein TWF103_007045 [Orbilia oligospora]KAF3129752.1 hypothetical protein TWF594_010873 [Orbilia oligospora]
MDLISGIGDQIYEARADIKFMHSNMDKEENRQIISWLTGTDYESIHADYRKKKDEWNGRIAKTEVETKDSKGLTALSLATQRGYKATVQLLLDAGAEIETDRNATIQSSGFQIWGVLVPPEGIVSESHPRRDERCGNGRSCRDSRSYRRKKS